MQIKITAEPYYLTPKPKLTKEMFDWLWANWWKVRNNALFGPYVQFPIETIQIRINQALSYMPYHFYININGIYEYHMSADDYDFKKHQQKVAEDLITYKTTTPAYYSRRKHFLQYNNLS